MTALTIDPKRFTYDDNPKNTGYVYSKELALAIRVAMATGRPLLLRGNPGTGKTTMARDLAANLQPEKPNGVAGADFYQEVVTSRTEARDLEWRFDALLRLSETQIEAKATRVANPTNYVDPRALWWGFNPTTAATRGGIADTPATDPLGTSNPARPAVVLIDEIDKAEPEVANDLLEPFDVKSFRIAETGVTVKASRPVFLVVTTNEERDLPPAFLRRCIIHKLERPEPAVLKTIAASHFGSATNTVAVVDKVLACLTGLVADAKKLKLREPGIAEFLDAIRACQTFGSDAKSEWDAVSRLAMWKHAT